MGPAAGPLLRAAAEEFPEMKKNSNPPEASGPPVGASAAVSRLPGTG